MRLSLVARWRGERPSGELVVLRPQLRIGEQGERVASASRHERRPNIILYLADTVRRDSLPIYGYAKPLTPYLDEFAKENDREAMSFTSEVMAALIGARWVGNVRELRNLVESLVVLAPANEIQLADLPEEYRHPGLVDRLPEGFAKNSTR